MYIDMKKIYRYSVVLVLGLAMVFYGIINWVIEDHSGEVITDAEVVKRARELGMVKFSNDGLEEEVSE